LSEFGSPKGINSRQLNPTCLQINEAYVACPGDKFYYSGRANPTNEAGPSTNIDEDFNIELDDFLGRED